MASTLMTSSTASTLTTWATVFGKTVTSEPKVQKITETTRRLSKRKGLVSPQEPSTLIIVAEKKVRKIEIKSNAYCRHSNGSIVVERKILIFVCLGVEYVRHRTLLSVNRFRLFNN